VIVPAHRNNMENKNIKELCKVVKEILEIAGIPVVFN
jgi:hypothetical protein